MARAFSPTEPVVENKDWEQCWASGFSGWHKPSWNQYLLRFFPLFGLPAATKVLVPLCGKTRDMEWLLRRGYHVVGLELSGLAIEDFFRERGLGYKKDSQYGHNLWRGGSIDIWEGDLFDLPDDLTDASVLYDRGALVALPLDIQQNYINKLKTLAPKLSQGLILGLQYDQEVLDGPPWSLSCDRAAALWGEEYLVTILDEDWTSKDAARLREKGLEFAHLTMKLEKL